LPRSGRKGRAQRAIAARQRRRDPTCHARAEKGEVGDEPDHPARQAERRLDLAHEQTEAGAARPEADGGRRKFRQHQILERGDLPTRSSNGIASNSPRGTATRGMREPHTMSLDPTGDVRPYFQKTAPERSQRTIFELRRRLP
jgi:hypothetical protein